MLGRVRESTSMREGTRAAHLGGGGPEIARRILLKATPISLRSAPAPLSGLLGVSVPSALRPAAVGSRNETYIDWLIAGGLFRSDPCPSPKSAMLTTAFRAILASGIHLVTDSPAFGSV